MTKKKISRRARLSIIPVVVGSMLLACNISNDRNFTDPTFSPTTPEGSTQTQELPQGPQEEIQVPSPPEGWVLIDQSGIEFWYDPSVIQEIAAETIPMEDIGGYLSPHPAYVQYTLGLDSGIISVVGVSSYERVYDKASNLLTELQELVAAQNAEGQPCIPELPLITFYHECGHQQFNANLAFINFQNGSGIRFVTVYAIQNTAPVLNDSLVYTFQGITNDHQCYVRVSFNPTHAELDGVTDYPPEIYSDPTHNAAEIYFSNFEAMFNANPDGFSPSLERLDQIISSFQVVGCSGG